MKMTKKQTRKRINWKSLKNKRILINVKDSSNQKKRRRTTKLG